MVVEQNSCQKSKEHDKLYRIAESIDVYCKELAIDPLQQIH